ncbi:hypothetical protein EN41_22165 [Agrobacterium tumefaciens]|nr:hypothetical protein EN41_22165 [Agrobacterium tumefaciens]
MRLFLAGCRGAGLFRDRLGIPGILRFFCDLLDTAAGLYRFRPFLENISTAFVPRLLIVTLDQQPVLPALSGLAVHAHQMPAAFQLLSLELELQMALSISFPGITNRLPDAAIPDDHSAAAILSLGDDAFEIAVAQWMVLHMHGKALVFRIEARAARHRPAFQHPVHFKAKIVMQAAGIVFLDDETRSRFFSLCAFGLRRLVETALGVISLQSHGSARFPRGLAA